MKNILALTVLSVAATFATVAPAMSQAVPLTAIGTLNVNAGVTKSCTNPVATAIALGNYDAVAGSSGNSNAIFKCTNGTTTTVAITSTNGGKLIDTTNPANIINYTFAGTNLSPIGLGLATGVATDLTVPVSVNAAPGQNPAPALSFTDTLNVTVTY